MENKKSLRKRFQLIGEWCYKNKTVSLILCIFGSAIFFGPIFNNVRSTPTAYERSRLRRQKRESEEVQDG